MKRHANTPLTPPLPPKLACHDPIPNIIDPPTNDNLLEQLEQQEVQCILDQNTQHGFGVTQITLTDATSPNKVHQIFQDEQPWGTDQNLCKVYEQNFHHIRDTETLNR